MCTDDLLTLMNVYYSHLGGGILIYGVELYLATTTYRDILDERIWTMPQRTGRPYKAVGNDYF